MRAQNRRRGVGNQKHNRIEKRQPRVVHARREGVCRIHVRSTGLLVDFPPLVYFVRWEEPNVNKVT